MKKSNSNHQDLSGKASLGLLLLVTAIAAVVGGGSAVVGTKYLPRYLAEGEIAPVVEPPDEEGPIEKTPIEKTPDETLNGFTMGNLPADEPVSSIKVEITVGADGGPLEERVDLHLGAGFPFRLYPVGGDSLTPAFAAFPQESTLKRGENSLAPGTTATFDYSASDSGGQDSLSTTPQLLRDLKVSDLQSIGFASQGSNNWVLAGYRIEVNGQLFAENDSVNLSPGNILGQQRDQLVEETPQNEALRGEIANLEAFVATGLASPNDEAELAKKKAEAEEASGPLNGLAGQSAGAYPWFVENHEGFKPAGAPANPVKDVEIMVVAGGGDKPGTRNPLYVRLGNKKFLLTSEIDPLGNDSTPQTFILGAVDLADNPLSPDDLKKPGLGLIGNEERFGSVPDRAKVLRLSIKSGGETIYDSEIVTEDRQALTTYWLRPPAQLDQSGNVQKNPETDYEKYVWLAGMIVPDTLFTNRTSGDPAPEPDPVPPIGGKTLPPPIPGPIVDGLNIDDSGGIGDLDGVDKGKGKGKGVASDAVAVSDNLPPIPIAPVPDPIDNTGLQNANLPIGVIQPVNPNTVTGQGAALGQPFVAQSGNTTNPSANRIILGGPPPPPPFNFQVASNPNGIFSTLRRKNTSGGNSPFVNPINLFNRGGNNSALTGGQIASLITAVSNLIRPVPPINTTTPKASLNSVRFQKGTAMVEIGDTPIVDWSVSGNTSQITDFKIELIPVQPDLNTTGTSVSTTVISDPTSRSGTMTIPITIPASFTPAEQRRLYLMPRITARANGVAIPGVEKTGPLMPLFPRGTRNLRQSGHIVLDRGPFRTPNTVNYVGGVAQYTNTPDPATPASALRKGFQIFNSDQKNYQPWKELLVTAPTSPLTAGRLLLEQGTTSGHFFDFVENKTGASTPSFFNTAGRTFGAPARTVTTIYEGVITHSPPPPPGVTGTFRGYRLIGHYGFLGNSNTSGAQTGLFNVAIELSFTRSFGSCWPIERDRDQNNVDINNKMLLSYQPDISTVNKSNNSKMHLLDIPIRFNGPIGGLDIAVTKPADVSPGHSDTAPVFDFDSYKRQIGLTRDGKKGPMTITVTVFMDSSNASASDSIGLFGLRLVPEFE